MLERVDGRASESVVIGTGILAYAYQKQGKFAESAPLLAPVREAVLRELGNTHWLYVEIENARAVALSALGKSLQEYEILAAIEPLLSQPPPGKRADALTIRNNLAVALTRIGRVTDAIPKMDAVIAELTDLLGPDAERTLKSQWFVGELLRQAGLYSACSSRYQRLAEQRLRVSGANHPLTGDALAKAAACAQLAGDEQGSGEYLRQAYLALPATDQPPDPPPQRTVLRALATLQMVALDRGSSQPTAAQIVRTVALGKALNLAPTAAESYWMTAIAACTAARAGELKAALQMIEALPTTQAAASAFSAALMAAYFLALDGQSSRAQAAMTDARALARSRYQDAHPVYQTMDYIDALIAADDGGPRGSRAAQMANALTALETSTGRKARLPLAPNWFAF